jgi:hypothetical protein
LVTQTFDIIRQLGELALRTPERGTRKTGMEDIETQFWKLCDDARRLDTGPLDARDAEPPMVEIIKLVEKHPEHREMFVRCFSDLVLWRREGPFMLVPFCMRRLRFSEIPALIARDAAKHEGTAYYASHMNHWSAISHAYLDKAWECALMYKSYTHELEERNRD